MTKSIANFGRNVRFRPRRVAVPGNEQQLLDLLNQHREGKIRVVGSRHAWSDAIETSDLLIDMRRFDQVRIDPERRRVTVGAGCRIKKLLAVLNRQKLTTPSLGLIAEQTIAGATATGTHGSGKNSLSHYIQSARIACFDEDGRTARIVDVSQGVELLAARCALGCLGVVVEVELPCIDQYYVREKATRCRSIGEVMALETRSPLQQSYLIPHTWCFYAHERSVADEPRRRGAAALYRIYWFVALDVGLHVLVKLAASLFRSRRLVHLLFHYVVPVSVFSRWVVVDRSDRALKMHHELFRHLELEAFVTRSHVAAATEVVCQVLQAADDAKHALDNGVGQLLESAGLVEELDSIRGRFVHHYPICFRRVLPDDTLISMTAGSDEDWYAISFITYVRPRDHFFAVASLLAEALYRLFNARIHWGKWFSHSGEQVAELYPRLPEFREVCRRLDPQGVFRNRFVEEKLGFKTRGRAPRRQPHAPPHAGGSREAQSRSDERQ